MRAIRICVMRLLRIGMPMFLMVPGYVMAQAASPFLTGATALQTNILAWLTPIAVILIMVLGAMAMANRLAWGWCIGAILGIAIAFGAPQIVVENCANTLILRSSASEGGGTARFASNLIGQREVLRASLSISRRPSELFGSRTVTQQRQLEPAVLDSEIEQLPDLAGYLKIASSPEWLRVRLTPETRGATSAVSAFEPRVPDGAMSTPIDVPTSTPAIVLGATAQRASDQPSPAKAAVTQNRAQTRSYDR